MSKTREIANKLIDGMSDVTITSPVDGQLLKYNGTNWVNETGVIVKNGNVGIGASSPAEKLDVNGKIAIDGTKFLSKISTESYIWNNTNSLNIVDITGNAVQMRINSSGNVLIGTTTDNGVDKLQVNGSIRSSTDITAKYVSYINYDTGISVNPGAGGKFIKVFASTHYSIGDATAIAEINIRTGYNGNHATAYNIFTTDGTYPAISVSASGTLLLSWKATGWGINYRIITN